MRRAIAIVALLAALPALAAAVCTPRTGYERCREVTFAAAAGTLTDIPLYVRTSGAVATSLDTYATTGAGVVFDISGSPVKTCRVSYAAGVGQWALGPVTRDTSALVVVMSYDKTGAESDESDCSNTTGPYHDYALVWWAGSTTDWSGNSRTATVGGSLDAGSAPQGPSAIFDGTNDHLTWANSGASGELSGNAIAWTAVVNGDLPTLNNDAARYLFDRTGASNSPRCWWTATATTNGSCGLPGTLNRVRIGTNSSSLGSIAADTWVQVAFGADGDTARRGYLDGVEVHAATVGSAPATATSNLYFASNSSGSGNRWPGEAMLVMVRESTAPLSANWQAYEYALYVSGSAVSIGSETYLPEGSTPMPAIFYYFRMASHYAPAPGGGGGDEQDAAAAPSSVCDGLPGAYPVQVGDAWDCYGGDRELLSRVNP